MHSERGEDGVGSTIRKGFLEEVHLRVPGSGGCRESGRRAFWVRGRTCQGRTEMQANGEEDPGEVRLGA